MANYIAKGRQVVIPLTNKSGNAVEYGDVVICDTGTAESFDVTTTTGYSDSFIGVVVDQAGIANDAVGRICLGGYVAQVNLDGAASIGDFLFTDTVAEQGTPSGTRAEGAFGQALTASATPAAIIWGVPDGAAPAAGSVATDAIWDAAGDLVQGTGANTAARLPVGTAYQILRVNSGATAVEWASSGRTLISEQTPTGTTASFTSIPSTFTHLRIEYVARTDRSGQILENAYIYFNNDTTATNYYRTTASAVDTTMTVAEADTSQLLAVTGNDSTAGDPGYGFIDIFFYKATTYNKCANTVHSSRRGAGAINVSTTAVYWESTVAITQVDLVTVNGSNFVAGSTFRLYGVF